MLTVAGAARVKQPPVEPQIVARHDLGGEALVKGGANGMSIELVHAPHRRHGLVDGCRR